MDETEFDWDDLRLFIAVAKHGGLAGAADESGKSAPTLGRRMLALERRLNQTLFERKNTGYALTPDGEKLSARVQAIQQAIDPIASNTKTQAAQRVKISAGSWTTFWLCQHLSSDALSNNLTYQFIAADHELDIAHREAVIGIRNKPPTHHSLAGRRLGTVEFAVYAADTNVACWAKVVNSTPSAAWVNVQSNGQQTIEVSHPRNALDLALAGRSKTVLPTFVGEAHAGLTRVCEPISSLSHDQWLVSHHEDRHLPEVRQALTSIANVFTEYKTSKH